MRGVLDEDQPYLKSVVLHQYLFGYELPDTVMLLTLSGDVHVLATRKKCDFLEPAVEASPDVRGNLTLHIRQRNKADGNAENFEALLEVLRKSRPTDNGDKQKTLIGTLLKEVAANTDENGKSISAQWNSRLSSLDTCEVSAGLSMVLSIKDSTELDLLKKSSVLSNKLMKHGCVKKLESIIEESKAISHEGFASLVEQIVEDPSEINLKIPKDDVQACYFPVVQSGGQYDLRISAASSDANLKHDIILVSLGARYKLYCSHISRTFLVDPPKSVSNNYETLLGMQEACVAAIQHGKPLKSVYKAAVQYLRENRADHLVDKLPKNLGFCTGLEFRDSNLTLSPKNPATLRAGMVVALVCGFSNIELTDREKRETPKESDVRTNTHCPLW